jgi:hypothetical protein
MLDFDLVELYDVETRVFNQAITTNSSRVGRFVHPGIFTLRLYWIK